MGLTVDLHGRESRGAGDRLKLREFQSGRSVVGPSGEFLVVVKRTWLLMAGISVDRRLTVEALS